MDPISNRDASPQDRVTSLLLAWRGGDEGALADLMPLVYRQLKGIAHRLLRTWSGREGLETTALVHEAYLRLADLQHISWQDRAHFFAVAARAMRPSPASPRVPRLATSTSMPRSTRASISAATKVSERAGYQRST